MSNESPYSFLICSFADAPELLSAQKAIKETSKSLGFDCCRVDEFQHNGQIINQIYESVFWSSFVIADMTGNRPNCYYEVGYADALKRPLIPLIKKGSRKPHFDLSGRSLISYDNENDLKQSLEKRILKTILYSEGASERSDPHKGKFGRYALVQNHLAAGRLVIDAKEREYFNVQLTVSSLSADNPLRGYVTFYLHQSIKNPERKVLVKNGIATCKFWSYGTFTVGIYLHQTQIQLEIDLKDLPGSTDDFKAL